MPSSHTHAYSVAAAAFGTLADPSVVIICQDAAFSPLVRYGKALLVPGVRQCVRGQGSDWESQVSPGPNLNILTNMDCLSMLQCDARWRSCVWDGIFAVCFRSDGCRPSTKFVFCGITPVVSINGPGLRTS
jgi:hypothetical protein